VALILATGVPAVAAAGLEDTARATVFRTHDTGDGLPSGEIHDLAQDHAGYIWMATRSGLVRFDGESFRVLRHIPDDPESLPSNSVQTLLVDSSGRVWAGLSEGGLVRVSSDLRVLEHYSSGTQPLSLPGDTVWSIAEGCDGSLWLGLAGQGIARLWPGQARLEHVHPPQPQVPGGLASGSVVTVFVDKACRLWAGAVRGSLQRLDAAAGRFRTYPFTDTAGKPLDGHIAMTLLQQADGTIWVGSSRGLGRIRPASGNVELVDLPVPADESDPLVLVTGMTRDSDGGLWLATVYGVYHQPKGAATFNIYRHQPPVQHTLPINQVWSVMKDHEGGLWFGTLGGGAAYLPPHWDDFRVLRRHPAGPGSLSGDRVIEVHVEGDKALWVGTFENGLNRVDLHTGEVRRFRHQPGVAGSLPSNRIWTLAPAGGERLWVGTARGVGTFAPDSGYRPLDLPPRIATLLEDNWIDSFAAGVGSTLWLGSRYSGLLRFDRAQDRWRAFNSDNSALLSDDLITVERDDEHHLLVVSSRGIQRWDRDCRCLRTLLDTGSDRLTAFRSVGDNGFWVATLGALTRYTRRQGQLVAADRYSNNDGLPLAPINGIQPDRAGRLWLSSRSGLIRIDPRTRAVTRYGVGDGLPSIQLTEATLEPLADGRLVAGTLAGLAIFHPDRLQRRTGDPQVVLQSVATLNRSLTGAALRGGEIELPHDDNVLTFSFNALTYAYRQHLEYRYRLAGWDADWLTTRDQNRVTYSRLPHGAYRFEVEADFGGGEWGDTVASFELRIRRPPWLSAWAQGGYMLLGLAAAGGGWRSYQRRRRRARDLARARARARLAESQADMARDLSTRLDRDHVVRVLGDYLLEHTAATGVWVVTAGRDGGAEVSAHAGAGDDAPPADVHALLDAAERDDAGVLAGAGACLAVSLGLHAPRRGAVILAGAPAGEWSEEARQLARLSARVAGRALDNAELLDSVRRLAVESRRASDAKSDFVAALSHEIRTPLHGIKGMAELLQRQALSDEQRELVATLQDSSRQLDTVVEEVLDLSKIEAGRIDLAEQLFDLYDTLGAVGRLFAPVAREQGLCLAVGIGAGTPRWIRGDPGRLRQVLGNLVNNAVKFTAAGYVRLAARREGKELVLAVTDTGPGLSPRQVEGLFEPFSQGADWVARRHGGSGLGLAISRQLARRMGGEVDVRADPDTGGSRFALRLPLAGGVPAGAPPPAPLQGLTLHSALSAPLHNDLEDWAVHWGCRVTLCADAATALSARDQRGGVAVIAGEQLDCAGSAGLDASSVIAIWPGENAAGRPAAGGAGVVYLPFAHDELLAALLAAALASRTQ